METRSDLEEVVKKKACKLACLQAFFGGELGIRTLGTLRTQHFEFYRRLLLTWFLLSVSVSLVRPQIRMKSGLFEKNARKC